jgi:hypothetical protein
MAESYQARLDERLARFKASFEEGKCSPDFEVLVGQVICILDFDWMPQFVGRVTAINGQWIRLSDVVVIPEDADPTFWDVDSWIEWARTYEADMNARLELVPGPVWLNSRSFGQMRELPLT